MNDGNRIYPVNIFVLHHSMGPQFVDTDDLTIQDWFSNTGKARAYNNGSINPMHEHPGRPGQLTYAQAQFAGSPDSSNKYNYKLTDLIKDPWGNVAWHAGNWPINQQSCGIECCGDYQNQLLENRQLMCIADFLRGIDQELVAGGCPGGITVMLHSEVYATACPGRIAEQRDTLVDMINNPIKWNAELFPVTPPVHIPVVTTKTETKIESIAFAKKTVNDATKPVNSVVVSPGLNGIKTITYLVTYTDGKETARTLTGTAIATQPIDEITMVGTYVAPVIPASDEDEDLTDSYIKKNLWQIILSTIKSFIKALKGDK